MRPRPAVELTIPTAKRHGRRPELISVLALCLWACVAACPCCRRRESCYRFLYLHQGTRLRSAPPGALPGSGCARAPAFGPLGAAAADARPQWIGPKGMRREPSPRLQDDASGGGAQTPGWEGRRSRVPAGAGRASWGLPSRPPSTQAEPSSRGPGRQGRSYSGALHLDALNHDRSTTCGPKADGMGAGASAGLAETSPAGPTLWQYASPIFLRMGELWNPSRTFPACWALGSLRLPLSGGASPTVLQFRCSPFCTSAIL